MRKIFVTMLLLGSGVSVFAQGTVYFSNNAFEKIFLGFTPSADMWTVMPATAGLFNFGLFYGTGATQPATLSFLGVSGYNSATSAGLIVNAAGSSITALPIPGTFPGETDVWVQIAGWTAAFGTNWVAGKAAAQTTPGDYWGQSAVVNAAATAGGLGPTTGPGAIIWQTATGTDPTKIAGGFVLYTTPLVPEPSTMALFGLGVAAVLIFRRRK
jgi:hypothetical protein